MEVLGAGKPLVVIVNENLMDNHQTELAERLALDRYLVCGTVGSLSQTIHKFAQQKDCLVPYTQPDRTIFSSFLNQLMKV
jgi:beta-1,4-N-acetylglucosaminyltransferase